jgi:predicted RNase H-like nuclease (RuvC/YqgF family)
LQQAIDSLKKVRPTTSEEDVRRENGKLKVQLAALGNMDKTRAQLAHELAEIKTRLSEKEKEILESKNHNARAAFTEQRAAIKEFTDRVQAELEKENRNLQTRSAMAEEQIKEINAYMAQSTLAYQKEIMRLRSIIQATAPERLRSPRGIGGGGGGGGETGGEHPKNLRASKAGLDAVRAVGGMNRSFDARKSGAGPPAARHANAPAVDKWVNDGI